MVDSSAQIPQEIVAQLFEDGYLVTVETMKLIRQGLSYQTIKQLLARVESVASTTLHKVTFDESHVNLSIVKSYVDNHKEVTVQDFVGHLTRDLLDCPEY